MSRSHARGFSLVETMIAVAIAVVVGWLLVHVLAQMLLAGRLQSARDVEQSTVAQLVDDLTTEEDDAWAIYVPPTDALAASNSDGHEVDYFTRDAKQQPYFWTYTYDAAAHTVKRYRLSAPGGAPVLDVTYNGIASFSAQTYPVTALQDASTPIYSALYNGASLASGIVHFYPGMPWIAGGNNITYVHFEGRTLKRDLQLVTQTAPSGFTVVLNYTPAPTPTPAAGPVVFPAAIVFAAPNMTLAAAPAKQPTAMAMMLNALLGGGVAYASSGSCTSVAYADEAMTQRLPAGTLNPYTGEVAVDTNGCYTSSGNSAYITVHEDGYGGAFNDAGGTCGSAVTSGGWVEPDGLHSPQGPTSSQLFAANTPTSGCSVSFTDDTTHFATAYAAVTFPNPMYAIINSTQSDWTYDCAVRTRQGTCTSGGWQSTETASSMEYTSADQGGTWNKTAACYGFGSCPYPAQFTDTQTLCTQDKAGGPCGVTDKTTDAWTPYAPPNAP